MNKRTDHSPARHTATPATKGKEADDKKFTSYDTKEGESSSPQKVRENEESAGQHKRSKEAK